MFLKLSIYKIEGDSMSPSLNNNTFVLIRPFKKNSLSISLFATDFIKGFPKYAEDYCTVGVCETRFYGSISLNF